MRRHTLPFFLAIFLLVCCTGRQEEHVMRQAMQRLQERNQADSLLTDDSLALAIAHYFDRHGTSNDRMEAHYLLARTYADRGEAPQALNEFYTAAECADTTAADCNYAQLCRVYSQMAILLFHQNLTNNYLCSLDKAIHYAEKAADTLAAYNLFAQKIIAYSWMGNADSVISIYEQTFVNYNKIGLDNIAARYSASPIISYLKKGEIEKARQCIDIYEKKSGYFNSSGEIKKGREYYYQQKGQYFLAIQEYDSAEHYLRKELCNGKDFYNQEEAAIGLSRIFQIRNKKDSLVKYALYGYEMQDSFYTQMATEEVAKAKAIYDYTNFQRREAQARENAALEKKKAANRLRLIFFLLAFIITLACWWNYMHIKAKKTFRKKINELAAAQSDILELRSHEEEMRRILEEQKQSIGMQKLLVADLEKQTDALSAIISNKEATVEKLRQEIVTIKRKSRLQKNSREKQLQDSSTYKEIHKLADAGKTLTDEDWQKIYFLIINQLPDFYDFISSEEYQLDKKHYQLCFLLRMHISALCASNMLNVHPSYITKMSKNISQKLFNCTANYKELAQKLSNI